MPMSQVVKDESNCRLEIIGSGELLNEMKTLSEKLNIQNYVKFIGSVPNNVRESIYKDGEFLCWRQDGKGFGIVLIEAMASGLPIIATNVDAIPEIVINNKTGLLCDPENPTALAQQIKKLIKNQNKSKSMGLKGRIRTEKHFSIDNMIKLLEQYYLK